jgi:hypothetical protein
MGCSAVRFDDANTDAESRTAKGSLRLSEEIMRYIVSSIEALHGNPRQEFEALSCMLHSIGLKDTFSIFNVTFHIVVMTIDTSDRRKEPHIVEPLIRSFIPNPKTSAFYQIVQPNPSVNSTQVSTSTDLCHFNSR